MNPPSDRQVAAIRGLLAKMVTDLAEIMPRLEKINRDIAEAMGRARVSVHATGAALDRLGRVIRPAVEQEDVRERALRARQTRNTGPARDPFTHRGSASDRRSNRAPAPDLSARASRRLGVRGRSQAQ